MALRITKKLVHIFCSIISCMVIFYLLCWPCCPPCCLTKSTWIWCERTRMTCLHEFISAVISSAQRTAHDFHCRTRNETLFPVIFDSRKLRLGKVLQDLDSGSSRNIIFAKIKFFLDIISPCFQKSYTY